MRGVSEKWSCITYSFDNANKISLSNTSLNYQNTTWTSNLLTMNLQLFHLLPKKCWFVMHGPSMKIVIMGNFLGWTRFEMWQQKIASLISSQMYHGQPFLLVMNCRLISRHDSYQEYIDQLPIRSQPIAMEKCCEEQKSPMFHYHYLLVNLKLLVLQFVRCVRSGNKSLYLAIITKIVYYFFALNHFCSRWTPVHICDMIMLPEMHADISRHFEEGCFTIK